MELPGIGKRCAVNDCKQLDFLPLQCRCEQVFCSQHFTGHSQACTQSKFVSQDMLNCVESRFLCSQDGCKHRSIVAMMCNRCCKHFCVKHRHLATCENKTQQELETEKERYLKPARQFAQAIAVVDKHIEGSLTKSKNNAKTKELADKVHLMKVKNKATGLKTIPMLDRVYFNIHIPGKIVPVFVSKTWSLGRAIDAIAEECKLLNKNHKSNEKKLRLFKKSDFRIVSDDLSKGLTVLLEDGRLLNGEDIVIDYVVV